MAEAADLWRIGVRNDNNGRFYVDLLPAEDVSLDMLPSMLFEYNTLVNAEMVECLAEWYSTPELIPTTPFIIKYRPGSTAGMETHIDKSRVSIIISLNETFSGGGTYFPALKYHCLPITGRAISFPGRPGYQHSAVCVTEGTRFVIVQFFV